MDEIPEDWRTHTGLMHLGAIKALNIGAGGELFHDLGHHSCLTGSNTRPWILTQGTDDEGPVARKLHPRERCRIQGFPDGFELKCTTEVLRIKQLGNSVPPPMVEWIGLAVAEQYRAAFVDDDDDDKDDNGNDQDGNNRKGTTTPKAEKSSRKSRRKPHKSKHHSHRHSKRHSKRRSRHSSGRKSRRKSRDSRKSSRESSRKRKLSLDLDMSPPPKRQHRERASSPEGEDEFSVRTAGFDDNMEELARR